MANDKLMTYEQGSDMITKLNTIAANISQINKNIDLGANKVTSMAGYTLQSDASNITTSDTLNQAVSKLEKRVEDNENNISKQQDSTAQGGNGYAIVNGTRVYVGSTAPTGDIPDGSIWIGG